MRVLVTFAALFLSIAFLQLAAGSTGSFDALTGLAEGFHRTEVGMLGSAHFVGFLIGCWWVPRLLGEVGHARAYSAMTALGAIGIGGHVMVVDPYWWSLFRMLVGLCVAGCYTGVEAWLQAKVTNESRGRMMGVYRIVDVSAAFLAQAMIGYLAQIEVYLAYNLLTMICCASLLPMALTKSDQPATPAATRLRPGLAWRYSPLATLGVVVAAISAASLRMVGPIFGQEIGLTPEQIGYFLAVMVIGGAAAQYPIGWLADKYDRRWVLIWLSAAAMGACGITVVLSGFGAGAVIVASGIFGFTTYPIYSVSAAHAHDFASDADRVELSAALMFFYAVGAIGAPYGASALIDAFGPKALYGLISAAHLGLVVFGILRMRARPTRPKRTDYVYVPRTSFVTGKLLRRSSGAAGGSGDQTDQNP